MEEESGISWVQFATVRHPIKRFLSGYADKCLRRSTTAEKLERFCLKCKDIHCFVKELYNFLNLFYAKNFVQPLPTLFTDYDYVAVHFAPQNWYCNFDKYIDDYNILRQGENREGIMKYAQEFKTILTKANVPDEYAEEIHRQLLKFVFSRSLEKCLMLEHLPTQPKDSRQDHISNGRC
ncbi:unnamed protein product [Cylicocyclus nassatus]|uniref:Uncharacterized protein n=1 Tax=Cylicocyclus nassatus TaxID=53992 RepID=A0AA36DL76_CYLNA|nr:unnamed protein product [Cylicocyclus nassatus]